MEQVNVVTKEDYSVQKKLQKTADSLRRKYTHKRKINEKLLRKKTPFQKTLSIFWNTLCILMVTIAGIVCFSGINSKIQRVCPTFAGYTNLTIKSGSMIASGFHVGDALIVRSVDTHTLHEGDKIAFYVYKADYTKFNINTCIRIEDDTIPATKFITRPESVFGIQTSEIQTAAKSGSELVFHHIRSVFEDDSGKRWFRTYGSSNMIDDVWYISEDMVVGTYVNSSSAVLISRVISATNARYGFLILLVPLILLGASIVIEGMRKVQLAKLELDCIEEKRRITDPICVAHDIGYNMDTATKYKILAQADSKNYNEYISLLWRNGERPSSVRKYFIRKELLLSYNRKMIELNRECADMFKNNENPNKIARYYTKKKAELLKGQQEMSKILVNTK